VSISPTFYAQILHAQIPKEQKKTDGLTVFFELLGSTCVKGDCKMLILAKTGEDLFDNLS